MQPLDGGDASDDLPPHLKTAAEEEDEEEKRGREVDEEGDDKSDPMAYSELPEREEGVEVAADGMGDPELPPHEAAGGEEGHPGFEKGDVGAAADQAKGLEDSSEEEEEGGGGDAGDGGDEEAPVLAPAAGLSADEHDSVGDEAAAADGEHGMGEEAASDDEDVMGGEAADVDKDEAMGVGEEATGDDEVVGEGTTDNHAYDVLREEASDGNGDDVLREEDIAGDNDDDVLREEAAADDDDGVLREETVADEDDDEDDVLREEAAADDDDDDVLREEAAADDDDDVLREEVAADDDDDDVLREEVAADDDDDVLREDAAADNDDDDDDDDALREEAAGGGGDDDDGGLREEAANDEVAGEGATTEVMDEEDVQIAKEVAMHDALQEMEPVVDAPIGGGGRRKRGRPSAIEEVEGEQEEASVFEDTMMTVEEEEQMVETASGSAGKRKRGRPPKSQAAKAPPRRQPKSQAARAPAKRKEEEEVCFICFDGGDLVLCDRRGCPKVYHPACVNRDESFFRSKGRWNCGWHICSLCQKSAHFMCYTCTYSLCKGCIKEAAGFICVRGNKGFCETCLSTVMLIEKNDHVAVGVDFDDRNSWMHMFKEYWLHLKGKLSLTFEELDMARTSRKGSNISAHNVESSDELYNAEKDHGASSDSSLGHRGGKLSSRKKMKKHSRRSTNEEVSVKVGHDITSGPEDIEWASKELLELVTHMRNGDRSLLSQFDVQNLLLDYIKQNNLRDPRRKSHIICDSMLQNLFGKPRVGHFEMLKLLESHFLVKENSQLVTDDSQGGVVDPDSSQADAERNSDASTKMSSDKKRKTRKRFDGRELQYNLDDYAAIDVYNINLMYLRRNLMEDLIDDVEGFYEKVVGSFVRIRISGSGQRQDMYRLVQVMSTRKAAERYKTGKKMTDILLEILNLNRTEIITIDIISNQEFTEEECKRLRQSIKCGLIGRLTVGEVQEKARLLQAVRVNDWLENEKSRLGHLRDRASEQGRRKQLRECVEKLQLLNTPEERIRRLNEVPEIHADPNMDPDYESAEDEVEPDDKKGDSYDRQMESSSFKKGMEVTSPGKGGSFLSNSSNGLHKSSNTTRELNRNTVTEGTWDRVDSFSAGDGNNESSPNQGKDVFQVGATGLESGVWNASQPGGKPAESTGIPGTTSTPSTGVTVPFSISETEKMWHYQDPSGKIQGPFSMTQLRKWNTTGYFPPTLKIWRASESPEVSILLADALIGKFQKDIPQPEPQHHSFAQSTNIASVIDSRQTNHDGSQRENNWRGNSIPTLTDSDHSGRTWNGRNNIGISVSGNKDPNNNESWAAQPSTWSTPKTDVVNSSRGLESSINANAWTAQSQDHNSPRPTAPFSGSTYQQPSYQGRGVRGVNSGRWHGNQDYRNTWNSNRPRGSRPGGQGYERQHSNWSSPSQPSSEHWRVQPGNAPPNQWANDSFNMPTTTPQPLSVGWMGVQGVSNQSLSIASAQPMSSGWGATPRHNETHQTPVGTNESNVTMPVSGWGSNCTSISMSNIARVAETVNAVQFPVGLHVGDVQTPNQQVKPYEPKVNSNEMTTTNGATSDELKDMADKKLSLGSDCPSPTPRCEQHVSNDVSNSEYSQQGPSQLNDRHEFHAVSNIKINSVKQSPEELDALTRLDSSTPACPEGNSLQSQSSVAAEGLENKQIHPVSSTCTTIKPNLQILVPDAVSEVCFPNMPENATSKTDHDDFKYLSAKKAEDCSDAKPGSDTQVWSPISAPKPEPHVLSLDSVPGVSAWQENQAQKPESNLREPEHVKSGNHEALSDIKRSGQSMPSPTPATRPSGSGGDNILNNNQNSQLYSSHTSRSLASCEEKVSASSEPAVQPNTGWGLVPQNVNSVAAQAQGNGNLGWGGSAIHGNVSSGWGTVLPGSMNVAWGIPAQANANVNLGFVAPAQANSNVNPGWTAPPQGNTNVNMGWVAPAQGNMSEQVNTTLNPAWGTLPQGGLNSVSGNTPQNVNWVPSLPTSSNANASWGTRQASMTQPWDPSAGNPNGWNNKHQHNEDGNSSQGERGFHGNDSDHGSGRHSWNRMHSGGGGSSSQPPRGGYAGACKFYESGYCKKGANCNYRHL